MFSTRKTIFRNYTMVEILVVLAIVGILMSIAIGGIGGLMKRQGAAGAVRNIGSKLSLARSYAVMKNSYVALLLPNDNPDPPGTSFSFTTGFNDGSPSRQNAIRQYFFYKSSRLCVVTPSVTTGGVYTFSSWIDGDEWDELPSGSCAYIANRPVRVDGLTISFNGINFPAPASVSAVVFKPSGIMVGGSDVAITAFMARYIPTNQVGKELVYETKSGQNNAWKITINPFTGRSRYEKKTDN
jgi:prepilin-type N-terminal cleavage/methylation domain-containing protein